MSESTIAGCHFEVLYNPNENGGINDFGIVLTNESHLYLCTGRITLSNGTLSLSRLYRGDDPTVAESWSASIRYIRQIDT